MGSIVVVGPNGEVKLPKEVMDKLGIGPGSEMAVELDVGEHAIVLRPKTKPQDFVEELIKVVPCDKKLRRRIDLKRVIEEEVLARHGLSGR